MFHNQAFSGDIPPKFKELGTLLAIPDTKGWEEYRSVFIRRWGREPGQERWQMKEVSLSPDKHEQVTKVLTELGFISAWQPRKTIYQYAILPGATLPSMKSRLDWLAEQWRQGIRFQQLIVLTGQRPLTPEIDHFPEIMTTLLGPGPDAFHKKVFLQNSKNYPMHETEAARLLLYYYPFPPGMEQVPIQVVDSPRKWQGDSWRRSHTADTVQDWMAYSPKPGNTLVISSQPAAHYQSEVFKRHLPPAYEVDTSAPSMTPGTPMAVLLDSVATWLRLCDQPPEIH